MFDRANHCRQIGTLGGQKTAQTYGVRYMRALGSAGFATTCQRYYEGNRAYARAALLQRKPLSFHGCADRQRPRPPAQVEIGAARMAAD